jgi:hypothetical protein
MIQEENYTEIHTDHAVDDDSKAGIIINGEKLIAPNGYTILMATRNNNRLIVEYMKNKPQYPKTYEECCDILQTYCSMPSRPGYKEYQIALFQKLLICRDAYWKIAGKEMELSEPWKPDWNDGQKYKFAIIDDCNKITKETYVMKNAILAFPTEEMRDAFLENFNDLIEKCKELL